MDNIDPDTVFHGIFIATFVLVMLWMIEIMKRNPTSRVPYVVLPVFTAIFAFASWLFFDNAFEKVIMLPIVMIIAVWMFKGGFKNAARKRAEQNKST